MTIPGGGTLDLKLEDLTLRIGLISICLILFNVGFDLWTQGEPFQHPLSLGLSFVAWVVGITLAVLALVIWTNPRLMWLVLAGLLFVQLAYTYLHWLNYSPLTVSHTDNEMIAQLAAQALKRGQNPYAWDFSDMLRFFRDQGLNLTPFLDGAFQNRLTYPILPTLTLVGFGLFGIEQVRVISLTFQMVLLVLVFVGAPARFRPIVLMPLFLLKDFVFLPLNGVQDIVWSALLVGVILAWKRPVWRAVLFGLASAYRQQPWIVAPFLLIYIWNQPGTVENRLRCIGRFIGVSFGTFALINLPFIIWDPRAWWLGVFEPAYASFNVYSHGLGTLSQYGLVPFPRQFYTVLQISSFVIMLAIHWRHPRFVGQAFWIFPAIFFWLYYRSLTSYWIYWIPPLLLALVNHLAKDVAFDMPTTKRPSPWIGTATLAVSLLVPNLLWGVVLFQHRPPIETGYSLPLEVIDHGGKLVNRIKVTVTNTGATDLVPRFAVQRDPGVQSLPWTIDSGPERLRPGQSGEYVISADIPARAFPVEKGGQIVVTGVGGDYWQRAIQTIPADKSFTNPDMIVNPGFNFWPSGGNAPEAWTLQTLVDSSAIVRMELVDGQSALTIQLGKNPENGDLVIVRLAQIITFPDEFVIWVYPTRPSSEPLQQAFGLELDDGEHKLWILFGDSDDYGRLGENFCYVYLPAPLKAWSRHTIHPQILYDRFGWQLPSFSPRHRNGLKYLARQTQLSLLVASRSRTESLGIFGPIEQDGKLVAPDMFLAEALAHPDTYYVNLGDEYRRQRNYDLAQYAYLKALTYNATSAEGHFGLAEASFWLGDWAGALEAFETSVLCEYHQPALPYRGMGWSYYNLGEYDQAKHAFEKAVRLDPDLADAHNGLGWVLLQEHRCDEAILYFERARTLAPDFPDPQRGIEECARLR